MIKSDLGLETARPIDDLVLDACAVERMKCAKDVCGYCAERFPGWAEADGPNSAGNWVHERLLTNERPSDVKRSPVLCVASAIFVRDAWLADHPR